MLTDRQIEDLSQRMRIPLEGVYFKDEIPSPLKYNKTYIINLQDSSNDNGDDNSGTHWTMFQVNKTPKNIIQPIYFDPYGVEPPEAVKEYIKKETKMNLPYTSKDIQSLMNNACGYYCLAMAHFINTFVGRSGYLYSDVEGFLNLFDDLNTSIDWRKNEYILKHFFESEDKSKRKPINIDIDNTEEYKRIVNETKGDGIDLTKIPVEINNMKK